ncbi:MAG: ABC transporter permease [Saprospiraceae bacterium]
MKSSTLNLVIFICLVILPLASGLVFAILYSFGLFGALSLGFTFEYWYKLLYDQTVWSSLLLSLTVALVSICIAVFIALMLSLYYRDYKISRSKIIFYLPLILPPIILSFWTFSFLGNSGIVSRICFNLGLISDIDSFPSLINDSYYLGVILSMIFSTFPVFTLLFLSFYESENIKSYERLAFTLGGTASQLKRKVAIPILLHRARPNIILYFIFLFGAFELPLILGRQSPRMISVLIHSKFNKFNIYELPEAYALSLIYASVVVFTIILLFNKK